MDSEQPEPVVVDLPAVTTAVISGVVPMAELPTFFDSAFSTIGPVLAAQGVLPTGAAFARYHGEPTDVADLEVGLPTDRPVEPSDGVVAGELPAGRVAQLVHRGSYDQLGQSWGRLAAWTADQGLTPGPHLWEVYLTEPTPEMDPAELRTELNLSITID